MLIHINTDDLTNVLTEERERRPEILKLDLKSIFIIIEYITT